MAAKDEVDDFAASDAEKDDLTTEERAALEDSDDVGRTGKSADDGADEDDAAQAQRADAGAPADSEGTDSDADGADAASQSAAQPARVEPAASAYRYTGEKSVAEMEAAVASAREQEAEIESRLDALDEQFDDGTLDRDDYRAQRTALREQRRGLETERETMLSELAQAKVADGMDQQRWADAQQRFFADPGAQEFLQDPEAMGRLQDHINQLLDSDAELDHEQLLAEAASRYWKAEDARLERMLSRRGLKLDQAQPAPADSGKKTPAPARDVRRTPGYDPNRVPATLANIPGAHRDDDVASSQYSRIDNLEGTDFEAAFAKMSEDEQERFLASAPGGSASGRPN